MEFSKGKLYSSIVGVLTAIPVYLIQEPLYILPFVVVFYHLFFGHMANKDIPKVIIFMFLIIVVLLTNFVGILEGYNTISVVSIFYFLISTFILAFSYRLIHAESFITWFLIASKSVAVYVFILFFTDAFLNGIIHDFTQSEGRMWAKGLVVGWPNGFALITSIAAFLCVVKEERLWALFLIITAMSTFSRMSMIFLVVIVLLLAYSRFGLRLFFPLMIGLIIFVIPLMVDYYLANEEALYRIAKYNDRLVIAQNLADTFLRNPFGIGNVSYREISMADIYDSYHSTWFKVLVRYGFIGLILFIALIVPVERMRLISSRSILCALLLVLAIPQDFLLLPSIAVIYSLVANNRDFINDKSRLL